MSVSTVVIIELLGGISLLLWGVRMVRTGVVRGWGDQLRIFLERQLRSRLRAFGSGVALTAVLGSSTAMVLIVTGLVAGATMTPLTGLVVVLGADVGSALIAAVLASGSGYTALLAPVALFAGYVIFSFSTEFRRRALGRVLLGLGMMLFALRLVVGAADPLREATLFHELIQALAAEPFLAFLIAALLTWLVHSSLAILLMFTSFVLTGSLEAGQALPFVLGLNLGAGLPAVTASLDQPPPARRLPVANLAARGLVAIAGLLLLPELRVLAGASGLHGMTLLAGAHLAFNLVVAVIFVPLAPLVLGAAERMMPDGEQPADPIGPPRYLNIEAVISPQQVLSNASVETLRMAEIVERMLQLAIAALRSGRLEGFRQVNEAHDLLETYAGSVNNYLGALADASSADARHAFVVMNCVSNLAHAGDVIKRNLSRRITTKIRMGVVFDGAQDGEIDRLTGIIGDSLRLLAPALTASDIETAAELARQKDRFRAAENEIVETYLSLSQPHANPAAISVTIFVDIVHDLHRINSHVASSGYPVVSAAGLLRDSRISEEARFT
ncbi:Na/Pi cotransporter family protein [Martelella soudanensis]|uniref:Na/Pi cotransporter family protein n=1 Tax=unclassified Martelella TaxID=2629616 RepID=UPI0015DEDC12|nr:MULTISPECIES: Na/Pi cotransporter family protein [unclassified Martelella]